LLPDADFEFGRRDIIGHKAFNFTIIKNITVTRITQQPALELGKELGNAF
jgi:hypothetical protein